MQFLGRLLDTVSSVSTLFSNPYRVRDVPQSDYGGGGGKIILKQEGRVVLYKNTQCQSWDCLLLLPETPAMALRLFQVVSEEDAMEWFQQYGLKLKPFYETLPLKVEMVQTIVDCIRSHPDWSSAHIAVETGLRDCLKHNLVQSQINCQDATGQTPLHLACEKSDLASLKALLEESQARTDIKDHNGDTPMHCASKQDSPVFIQALCSQLCSGVNTLNNGGETPLHVACRQGRVESIKALLEGGAKCDVDGNAGYPIHTAVKYSQKGCVEEILRADPSQLQAEDSMHGGTPLHWSKTAEMCRLLLNHGSDVNYLSRTGESALHILTERGRFEAAMVLLTHGAHANLKGRDGNTALHLAMKADNIEMIKALIVFGADVEIHNDLGETPGLIAARTSKGPNRKILLDMLRSVGVHRCLPPSPGSPPPLPISNKIKPQGIGFEHVMFVGAAIRAMDRGSCALDGAKKDKQRMDRLLCLDGGGIKGLVLIQMLIALEREAGRPIRELFDWIAGTSTGGILALAIIHGKNMEYLRCLYFRMKEQVFKGSRPYESAPLEEFLKTEFGENTKMTDVQYPRVMVTSVLADRHPGELHIFRNYDLPDPREPPYASTATFQPLITPQEQLVWRAARCSGAAPTYFRPMGRFLDGGLLANNPTLDAITEIHQHNKTLNAKGLQQDVKKLGVVVSLGTGKPPQEVVTSVDVFRPTNPLQLAKTFVGVKELGKMLVDCCTDSDGCTVDRARAWCEMVDTIYHRLSPQLSQEVMLDEVSDTVLVNMLWETQMYLFQKRDILQSLAQLLLQ
ncbi:85/88 kDa calcium-independent phospholipase A2 isoform X1 [Nothobranchius furzeri]|uniref:phospholipase A2 n=1 Tax=Nothobranchius furzeri TaxID=105023 RepID=A0A9D2YD26_NOTFU|nr:phospholipase A2 group VI [Nothobranchius furzeri]